MTPYPLSKSDRNTKILITLFLLTMAAAFAVAELNVYDKVGRMKNGVARRYGPDVESVSTSNELSPIQTDGERAESMPLDDELPSEDEMPMARMNTFTALVDVTHPHIFEIPVVIFVLAHFLMRTRAAGWFKLANYLTSFGGVLAFISAPWAVRYVTIKAAPMLYAGAIAMGMSAMVMVAVSLWDMWIPAKRIANRSAEAEKRRVVEVL